MATELQINPSTTNQTTVVLKFVGSLDATNLDMVEKAVDDQLLSDSIKKLIFDFSELEYLNSKAIGLMVGLSQKVAAKDATLLLAALLSNVEDIITVVGLNQIIPVAKTVEEAEEM